MARYQIIIAYDGTDFFGFQRQGIERTVQLEIEDALHKIGWNGKAILAAGRTDTGVHASGQVIAFDLDWQYSADVLMNALNANLPPDVAVVNAGEARPEFHPRYDATGRRYQYHIICQPQRDPLRERFAWRIWSEPDWTLAQQAAKLLMGSHDFAAFGKPMKKGGSTTRRIIQAEWVAKAEGRMFSIVADAFLYHMVRRIVFILVHTGLGKISLAEVSEALVDGKYLMPGLAPARGLVLSDVYYEPPEQAMQ